jgi:pyrroloquinoline quinone (PQQ) biosynthesis protein C
MRLPRERGPLSRSVLTALSRAGGVDVELLRKEVQQIAETGDPVVDDDLHLTLWTLYELHYRGFDEVAPDREWDPALIAVRTAAEKVFEQELRRRVAPFVEDALSLDGDLADQIQHVADAVPGPSLAHFLQREATLDQLVEFMTVRSIYHLKESDPTSFVLARVDGPVKAALAELLYDEYGGGRPQRLHATLFANALTGCGLDPEYGAYVDVTPGHTLAVNNAMSLFALHRRLRGASLGHLAAFEATSSLPCRRIAGGIRRLGLPDDVWDYFDEHVEADAVHEQVAMRSICGGLVEAEPALRDDVLFGAASCAFLDSVVAEHVLAAWHDGRTSLVGAESRP